MKFVVVENEIRIREGLIKLVQKINPDYQMLGEAKDGIEGARMITEKRPDLVITDIRMPKLDGLGMLNRLKENHIPVRAIVLSAYSEFAYARKALQLGVSEYLLKPISVGELSRSLKNIESQLVSDQEQLALFSMEKILHSVISGEMEVDQKARRFLAENYQVDTEGYFALVDVYTGKRSETDYQKFVRIIKMILQNKIGLCYKLIMEQKRYNILIVIYNVKDCRPLYDWFNTFFSSEMRRNGLKDFGTVWSSFQDLDQIREAAKESSGLLEWSLVLGDNRMISKTEIHRLQLNPVSYPVFIEGRVRTALCTLDKNTFESGIKNFIDYYNEKRFFSPREIKESFIRFIWAVLSIAREVVYEDYAAINQQQLLEQISLAITWRELEHATHILLHLLPGSLGENQNESLLVIRVKNMIHEFYSQGITLEEIAAKSNVTPEYLSTQFHLETGSNFSTYLKEYRIQKAKELLIGTNLKLYSVSKKIGYRDPKYFCRVFKDTTGLNPSEYRKTNR
jgi:two-component system response regulator YesN